MLTATSAPFCHPAASRHARAITQRPNGTIVPASSASGMNSAGGTLPRRACGQRTSASNPATPRSASRTIG